MGFSLVQIQNRRKKNLLTTIPKPKTIGSESKSRSKCKEYTAHNRNEPIRAHSFDFADRIEAFLVIMWWEHQ